MLRIDVESSVISVNSFLVWLSVERSAQQKGSKRKLVAAFIKEKDFTII
jgi:hypothetical protein